MLTGVPPMACCGEAILTALESDHTPTADVCQSKSAASQCTVLPAVHFQVTIQTDEKIASEVLSVAEFLLEVN